MGYHTQSLPCVSKNIASRYNRQYIIDNTEKYKAWQKGYYESHQEEITAYKKEWTQRNKDHVARKKGIYSIS